MPRFEPPLARHTDIPVPEQSSGPLHVRLTFSLYFDSNDDATGSWEIWTDLPQDLEKSAKGPTWRAIPFPIINASEQLDSAPAPRSDETGTCIIQIPGHVGSNTARPALTKSLLVPASPSTFSYTYRHVLPSGHIHWLGDGGSNGSIVVRHDDGAPLSAVRYTGIGLETQDDKIHLHQIPSESAIKPTALLLSLDRSQDDFFRLETAADSEPTSVVAVNATTALPPNLAAHSVSIPEGMSIHRAEDIPTALTAAMKIARATDIVQAQVEGVHSLAAALLYGGPVPSTGGHQLVIYSPFSKANAVVRVKLPKEMFGSAPLAIKEADRYRFMQGNCETASDRWLELRLQPGLVTQVVDIIPFSNLSQGAENPQWLAPINAIAVKVQDAQADQVTHLDSRISTEVDIQNEPMIDAVESDTLDRHVEDEAKDENISASKVATWSPIDALIAFFTQLWLVILGSFTSPIPSDNYAGAVNHDQPDNDEGEGDEDSGSIGTPTERTPLLLDSSGDSGASDSTAVSPLDSPTSTITGEYVPIAKIISHEESPVRIAGDVPQSFSKPAIIVDFASGPGVVLLPPADHDSASEPSIKVFTQTQGGIGWEESTLLRRDVGSDFCQEMELGHAAKTELQVKIEPA